MRASSQPRRSLSLYGLLAACFTLYCAWGCGGDSGSDTPALTPSAGAAAGGSSAAGQPAAGATPAAGTGAAGAGTGGAAVPVAGAAAGSGGAGRAAPAGTGAAGAAAGASGTGSGGSGGTAAAGTGSGGTAAPAAGSGGTAGAKLPSVTSTAMDGPFATQQDLMSGPKRASGLFRPMELGKDGVKHPIFLFGCGGGSNPATYAPRLNRIASHGFVVLADVQNIGDNDAVFKASVDWIVAENMRADSPLFGKLDTTKIAAGGHSIGSVNAFFFAPDPRLTTTIHVAGGSLDNVNDPRAPTTGMGGKSLKHPSAFITGDSDSFGNIEKAAKDYEASTVPVFFTQIGSTNHIAAVEAGLPAIIAWLRWHLAGETERRSAFLDPMGEFNSGKYKSQSKNW